MDIYNDTLELLLHKVKKMQKKSIYLCGDYNLDLLKHDIHTGTKKFLDIIYRFRLYPLIVKPSRISDISA